MDNYVIEYKGKTYPDIETFCKEFHAVKYKEHLVGLMGCGYSLEDALKTYYDDKKIVEDPEEIKERVLNMGYSEERGCYKDNRGNKFLNFTDMLDHLGLTYNTVYLRYRKGCSPKECLAKLHKGKKNSKKNEKKKVFKFEYNGKKYETKKELCKDLGISYYALSHIPKTMSLKEAVDSILCKEEKKKIYDHKGKVYSSEREMADAYNIPPKTLWARKHLGWSLQEALEIPVGELDEV